MKTTRTKLSLSILLATAISLVSISAYAKEITWPDNATSGDIEAALRTTPTNATANSLFVTSSLDGNTLNISSGNIGGAVYGAYATGAANATNNTVNIYGGTIGNGPGFSTGYAAGGLSINGDATGNTLNMYDGTVAREIYGGTSYNAHANYNTVNMTGGTVNGIAGGFISNAGAGSSASYNTVNISGGTIKGDIYGGDSLNGIDSNNTVNISGNVSISPSAGIFGGNMMSGTAPHSGNILNVAWAGNIARIGSFEYINFTINDAVIANNNTALTTSRISNVNNTHIRIASFEDANKWNVGDKITLLSQSSGGANLYGGSLKQGFARYLEYDMNTVGAENAIVATITNAGINTDIGDIGSGMAATTDFLKNAANLIDSAGNIDEIDAQSKLIGVLKQSRSRIGSNSNVTVSGTSMLLGFGKKFDADKGYIAIGGFAEAGWGSYSTNSNFTAGSTVNSSGKNSYHGFGVFFNNHRDNGVYSKINVRLGRASTKQTSTTLTDTLGNMAQYNTASLYYGASLSVGKTLKLSEKNSLDIYGQYLFLHQNGSNLNIINDQFEFQASNSHRLRTGAKYTQQNNANFKSYLDLAYEYELAGQAKSSAYGVEMPYISTRGGTAIAELGIIYKTKNTSKFEMKFSVQGYLGKRQGHSSVLEAKWKF